MAPSISDQIRMEYAVTGSGLAGGRYNVRKFVRDVGKLTELQNNVGTKAQRRQVGQAAADRATAAISGGKYNVRKFVRDVGKLTELQKNVGTKAQRRAVGQAAADRATSAIGGGVSLAGRGHKKTKLQAAMCT